MSTRHHVRSGSSGRKLLQQQNRSKPAPLTRRTNSNGSFLGPVSPSIPYPGKTRGIEVEVVQSSDWDEDMATFLQFCPTCEKQILTPSISVLYCSEACRRRDSAKSIPAQLPHSPSLSPYTPAVQDYTIVPRRSPTVLRPLSTTFSELSLYELNPKHEPNVYLDESTFGMPTQGLRPYIERSTSSEDSTQPPSLVHSPASSYGNTSHIEAARPLPRKHSCPTSKGINLVTPVPSAREALSAIASQGPRRKSAPAKTSREKSQR